jgi:isochorismate hydrolase
MSCFAFSNIRRPRHFSNKSAPAKDGEQTVLNSLTNAFAKTSRGELIRTTGRTELIIAGFMTHMCVNATTRAALDFGYLSAIAVRDVAALTEG